MTKRRLLPVILALGLLGSGLAAEDDPQTQDTSGRPSYAGALSLTCESKHFKPGNWVIGGAAATQALSLTRTNNLAPRDQLRAIFLTGFDLESGGLSDGTFGIEYGNETSLLGKIVGGYTRPHFRDRLSAGYQHWHLREEAAETPSDFVYGRWDHFSRAEWSLTGMYGFPAKGRDSAGLVEFTMTDSLPLSANECSLRLIPLVGVAYGVNWFGLTQDGAIMRAGLSLRRELNRGVGLELDLEGYRRLSGDETKIPHAARIALVVDLAF
jgi:hypothetical protein